jgi:histidine triad (HIT) family protein
MEICIFCKIVAKDAPADIVFENNEVLALVPLEKVSKGHTLLIPKRHFQSVLDIDEEMFGRLAKVMARLSKELVSDFSATGINLLSANGKDAQQSVPHFHFHLVPRYPDDGLDM